ncbi:MAG: hypothetical protein BWY70_01520 [Bacteroidetes bacterium ADurb.Bin408]|nr:MAG: hypothetical protein BWY70_01520 [Bacteroidetes bacterium ADurb.Bin408]
MYSLNQKIPPQILAPTEETIRRERQEQMDVILQLRRLVGDVAKSPDSKYVAGSLRDERPHVGRV